MSDGIRSWITQEIGNACEQVLHHVQASGLAQGRLDVLRAVEQKLASPPAAPTPAPLDVPVCPVKGCGEAPKFFVDALGSIAFGCSRSPTHASVVSVSRTVDDFQRRYREAVAAYRRDHPEETSDG